MKLQTVMLSSFVALSLVACGSGDDNAKPDDGNKNQIPPKTQACIDAGDLCKLENNKWVIHKKDEPKNPTDEDEMPVADLSFDYSDIGVTDTLQALKKGFSFWHKGEKSPLDVKRFKNGVTLSPSVVWSSTTEYDQDLYNFVALRIHDENDKKQEGEPIKFMFDQIGIKNQEINKNIEFFGGGAHKKTSARTNSPIGEVGVSSISAHASAPEYWWNSVPALVNTFMYRKSDLSWDYAYADAENKLFNNQEEESASLVAHSDPTDDTKEGSIGSGNQKLRVYGRNAFLSEADPGNFLDPKDATGTTPNAGGDGSTYDLPTRKGAYYRHVNYAWYDQSHLSKRKKKAKLELEGASSVKFTSALSQYKGDMKDRDPFPTDVSFGEMKSVQFGRLTGQGIDPESEDMPAYKNKKNLKEYPFTESTAAGAGNDEGEDWYFARGTMPTPVEVLDAYKSSEAKIAYDGQALMFGLDYKPTKPMARQEDESDQSTNSVKPAAPDARVANMLLDGKQNFVRMVWDPASGELNGKVFGVWTKAKYWRYFDKTAKGEKIFSLPTTPLDLTDAAKAKKAVAKYHQGPTDDLFAELKKGTLLTLADATVAQGVAANALELEPYIVPLVMLKGSVLEGTNSFGGKALRVKDGSKGLFAGAFFGPKGHEIGGVINSQTGSMKDENLVDPGSKWGGSFGAKFNPAAVEEDLIFIDRAYDYLTSTEVWN